jgi:hypothetical protein
MSPNGYNPMRYNCEKQGCFNQKMRPKIEMFSDCFPGAISFGDVDAVVEMNGYTLKLEWKSHSGSLPRGQQIMYGRTTRYGMETVICVHGNAETMDVKAYGLFWSGSWRGWVDGSLEDLTRQIKGWADWASKQPSTESIAGVMSCVFRRFKIRDVLAYVGSEVDRKEQRLEKAELEAKAKSQVA